VRLAARALLAAAIVLAGATACGDDTASDGAADTLGGTITVAAASSLTEAFTQVGRDFEAAHPGVKVRFTFEASSTLALQITEGAPADVFAAADDASMRTVTAARLARRPSTFARNRLEIATKPGNPEHIRTLADLAGVGVVALCDPEVPCGRLAATALRRAGVEIPRTKTTRADKVKGVVTAVAQGDAVAGIVYATDIRAAGKTLTGVPIPERANVVTAYPVAVLDGSRRVATARAFVEYLLSTAGQRTLERFGFLPP
jgi:molybdate transport system substrate-binding protein